MEEDKDVGIKEDKSVLVIEEANTKVLEIVNNAVALGWDKEYCKQRVRLLVEDTRAKLKELGVSDNLILNTANSIFSTFMSSWIITTEVLTRNAKKDKLGLIANTILQMDSEANKVLTGKGLVIDVDEELVNIGKGSILNLRDFITSGELGASQRFVDYTSLIKDTLNEINERLADQTMTLIGRDGRHLSVRNLAEIETRYKLISEDLTRNGIGVDDFVISSVHAASERCSWWQGKIFIVDLDVDSRPMGQYKGEKPNQTIKGYIDGKPYYSLREACENGFLSYNCQHRLIKYFKGARPPQYEMVTIQTKRDLTTRQRNMENTIRKYKRRQVLSNKNVSMRRKNPYTDEYQDFKEREYNQLMSKYWQEKYRTFSKDNGLPIYEWRLRITEAERSIK